MHEFPVEIIDIDHFTATPDVMILRLSRESENTIKLLQKQVFEHYQDFRDRIHKYYFPDAWIDHVTIASKLQKKDITNIRAKLKQDFQPFQLQIHGIDLYEMDREAGKFSHHKMPFEKKA